MTNKSKFSTSYKTKCISLMRKMQIGCNFTVDLREFDDHFYVNVGSVSTLSDIIWVTSELKVTRLLKRLLLFETHSHWKKSYFSSHIFGHGSFNLSKLKLKYRNVSFWWSQYRVSSNPTGPDCFSLHPCEITAQEDRNEILRRCGKHPRLTPIQEK